MSTALTTTANSTAGWWVLDTWLIYPIAFVAVAVVSAIYGTVALAREDWRKARFGGDEPEPELTADDFRAALDEIPEVLAALAAGWTPEPGDYTDAMATFTDEGGYQAAEDAYSAAAGAALPMRTAAGWEWKPPMGYAAEPGAPAMDAKQILSIMNAHRSTLAERIVAEWEPYGGTDGRILEAANAGFTRMAALQIVRSWFAYEGDYDGDFDGD